MPSDVSAHSLGSRTNRIGAARVLLVEAIDAAGGAAMDARERSAALEAAGIRAESVILAPGANAPDGEWTSPGDESTSGPRRFGARRADLAALRCLAGEGRYDRALVAAATPGGGAAARALMSVLPTQWWPTGFGDTPGWRALFGCERNGAEALDDAPGSASVAPPGLAWSSVDGPRPSRGRRTLWDGDYVLAPLSLSGKDGARALTAFARVAEQRATLDLVILADPQPTFERQARSLGIGARVHFVGAAAREAEWAWWTFASAALLGGHSRVAGGLILRGLAAGCPLVVASETEAWGSVGAWLAAHGCQPWEGSDGNRPDDALERALDRGPGAADAQERGRDLARGQHPLRLGARLALALAATRPASDVGRRAKAA